MEAVIAGIAERVAQGGAISAADAAAILESRDLVAIGAMADDVRRRMHGPRTTFQRVFEVHGEAVPASLPPNVAAGEIRIVGRPASAEAAIAAVTAMAGLAGDTPLGGFSLADLEALAGPGADSLERLCGRLRDAGLRMIAETPLDRTADAAQAVAAARRGGLIVTRLTIQTVEPAGRIPLLTRARGLQQALGGFRSLAPLPRTISSTMPTTGYDDVKLVAVARLLVTGVPSIQVDWALYGPKLAQVALTVGADDVDGIAAVETGALGRRRSAIEEIRGNIRAAALEPVERNARWETIGE